MSKLIPEIQHDRADPVILVTRLDFSFHATSNPVILIEGRRSIFQNDWESWLVPAP